MYLDYSISRKNIAVVKWFHHWTLQGCAFYFGCIEGYLINWSVCVCMCVTNGSAYGFSAFIAEPPQAHLVLHDRMQPKCGGTTNQNPI